VADEWINCRCAPPAGQGSAPASAPWSVEGQLRDWRELSRYHRCKTLAPLEAGLPRRNPA